MTFKPKIWFPIVAVLSALNLASVWFAARDGGASHATIHAAVALAFALWAMQLRQRFATSRLGQSAGLQALEGDVDSLRQELAEAQERLDFAERMLAQQPRGDRKE